MTEVVSTIRLNAAMYLVSAFATFVQVIVFSSVGAAKRYLLFLALFSGMFIDSFVTCVSYFALSNDASFLKGTGNVDQDWIDSFYQFGGVFTSSTNMILGFICFNMWALLQFQAGSYRSNMTWIHISYIAFSFVVGMVDYVIYLVTCNTEFCSNHIAYYGNIFSIFFVVGVGGASIMAVIIKLLMNRVKCLNVMKQSSISPSLFYRMMGGLIALIIIGAFSIAYVIQPVESTSSFNAASELTLTSLGGFAVSLVLGSSQECLQIWQKWIKKFVGIDLATRSQAKSSTRTITSTSGTALKQ